MSKGKVTIRTVLKIAPRISRKRTNRISWNENWLTPLNIKRLGKKLGLVNFHDAYLKLLFFYTNYGKPCSSEQVWINKLQAIEHLNHW